MREVLQIWSKNDTSTNTLFRLEKGGELKLLSECSLNNHLHMKLFKKKEETQKMATSKLRSCGNVSFSKTVLPVTALVSYPGSGNTWLRHLIQEVTGKNFNNVLLGHFDYLYIYDVTLVLAGFSLFSVAGHSSPNRPN